jgi:hypothetical protein
MKRVVAGMDATRNEAEGMAGSVSATPEHMAVIAEEACFTHISVLIAAELEHLERLPSEE